MGIKKFLILYFFYGIFLIAISLGVQALWPLKVMLAPNYWGVFLFLYFITLIAYLISIVGIYKGGQTSVIAIMGGVVIKLLFSMVFALVIIIKLTAYQHVFALNYFSLYFLLTLFEVMCLLRNLRHQNNK